jgi:hypothetical protein
LPEVRREKLEKIVHRAICSVRAQITEPASNCNPIWTQYAGSSHHQAGLTDFEGAVDGDAYDLRGHRKIPLCGFVPNFATFYVPLLEHPQFKKFTLAILWESEDLIKS